MSLVVTYDKWSSDMYWSIVDSLRIFNKELVKNQCKILGWKILEDELKFYLILEGPSAEKINKSVEFITEKLKRIFNEYGAKIDKILTSFIEDITYDPVKELECAKVFSIIEYFQKLASVIKRNKKTIKDLCKTPLNLSPKDLHKVHELIDSKILRVDNSRVNLTNLGISICSKIDEIFELLEKYSHIPFDKKPILQILYIVQKYNLRNVDKIIEKICLLSTIKTIDLIETIKLLEELKILKVTDEHEIHITAMGSNIIEDFLDFLNNLEKSIKERAIRYMQELFSELNSTIGYIALRNGNVSKFSFEKILYSLINAGINPNTSISTIDELSNSLFYREFINEIELVDAIVSSVNRRDPTGESAAKYIFYINTRDFIKIEDGEKNYPFTRTLIQQMILDEINKNIPELVVPEKFLHDLVEVVYEGIRKIFNLPIDILQLNPLHFSYTIRKDVIQSLIKNILPNYFPLYSQLLSEKSENIRKKFFEQIRNYVNEISDLGKKFTVFDIEDSLINLIIYIVHYIGMDLGVITTNSTIRNISAIRLHLRKLLRKMRDATLSKRYRRYHELLRQSQRLYIWKINRNYDRLEPRTVISFVNLVKKIFELGSE